MTKTASETILKCRKRDKKTLAKRLLDLRPKADPKAVVQGKTYRFTVLT